MYTQVAACTNSLFHNFHNDLYYETYNYLSISPGLHFNFSMLQFQLYQESLEFIEEIMIAEAEATKGETTTIITSEDKQFVYLTTANEVLLHKLKVCMR